MSVSLLAEAKLKEHIDAIGQSSDKTILTSFRRLETAHTHLYLYLKNTAYIVNVEVLKHLTLGRRVLENLIVT